MNAGCSKTFRISFTLTRFFDFSIIFEYINRFYASAEKIRITIPYTKDKLHQLIYRLVEANRVDTGHVYFQITRGASPRNHIFPGDDILPVLTGNTKENPRPVQNFENGVKATFVEDIRWLRRPRY